MKEKLSFEEIMIGDIKVEKLKEEKSKITPEEIKYLNLNLQHKNIFQLKILYKRAKKHNFNVFLDKITKELGRRKAVSLNREIDVLEYQENAEKV
jgi:hypothetical protein